MSSAGLSSIPERISLQYARAARGMDFKGWADNWVVAGFAALRSSLTHHDVPRVRLRVQGVLYPGTPIPIGPPMAALVLTPKRTWTASA